MSRIEYLREYRKRNREILLKKKRDKYREDPEKYKERVKNHRTINKERVNEKRKINYSNNSEKIKNQVNNYRIRNKQKINLSIKKRKEVDPLFKLSKSLRNRITVTFKYKSYRKGGESQSLLGATFDKVRKHIEDNFLDGMTWDNYGFRGWHIDHKIPLSSAKNENKMRELCHYTNLQPLWATDNFKKSNKILYT